MTRRLQMLVGMVGVLIASALAIGAADMTKALDQAEGRRRAAENGLKEIKGKGQPSEEVRKAYVEAATRQNAWLEAVCLSLEQGASAPPDVTAVTQAAAVALVDWVQVRNPAVGLPALNDQAAATTKKTVIQTLTEITAESSKARDPKRRADTVSMLKQRLHWKAYDEI